MNHHSTRRRVTIFLLLFGAPFAAAGAEPTPTATPTATPAVGEQSLSDVAGGITLNKEAVADQDGSIVISNDNLSSLAGKGHVTEVTREGPSKGRRDLADVSGGAAGVQGEVPGFAEDQEKKQYWQAEYQRQLDLVLTIRKQIDLLDQEIPGLWRDFYSRDDPFYRDGVIKPKIDEAMARRQRLEVDLGVANAALGEVHEKARRDGSQPGWFRGFEKPPTPKPTVGVQSR